MKVKRKTETKGYECDECGLKFREWRRSVQFKLGKHKATLCIGCTGKLRIKLRNAAWPLEGVVVRMNKDDAGKDLKTVDEIYASGAEVGFEQMNPSCYWLMISKDGVRQDVDFYARRKKGKIVLEAIPREQETDH